MDENKAPKRGKRQLAAEAARSDLMKTYTAHIIAILLVLLLMAVSLMSISGFVDLTNSAVSLFVGSLVGLVAGLLASPLVFYFGVAPSLPNGMPQVEDNNNGA